MGFFNANFAKICHGGVRLTAQNHEVLTTEGSP